MGNDWRAIEVQYPLLVDRNHPSWAAAGPAIVINPGESPYRDLRGSVRPAEGRDGLEVELPDGPVFFIDRGEANTSPVPPASLSVDERAVWLAWVLECRAASSA